MRHALPDNRNGHAAAFLGVLLLHGGLLWWQALPQPPMVVPQQQVIRVAMVTAAPQTVPQTARPAAVAAPVKTQKPQSKHAEAQPQQSATPRETTGRQSTAATAHHAALTEPIAADYLQNPPPVYPRAALRKRLQGTVMVEAQVGADGLPRHVRLQRTSGHPSLDDAALEAVRKWRFIPARRGDEVIEARVVVPVEFRIN